MATAPAPAALGADETPLLPEVAAGVPVRWLDPAAPWALQVGAVAGSTRYRAAAVVRVHLRFDDEKADLVHDEEWEAVLYPLTADTDPAAALAVDYDDRDLTTQAPPVATYVLPGAPLKNKTFWSGLQRGIVDTLVRNRTTDIFVNKALKLYARVGEDQDSFIARCREAGQDLADAETAKLRDKYRTKVAALEAKMATAHEKASVSAAKIEAQQADQTTSLLGDVLGSFLGGRKRSRSIARTKSTAAESARLQSANQQFVGFQQDAAELTQELEQEVGAIVARWDAKATDVEVVPIRLEKADVVVDDIGLVWVPVE